MAEIDTSPLGLNRTGIGLSPIDSMHMEKAAREAGPSSANGEASLAQVRENYARQGGRLGSVPLPSTMKGVAVSAGKALKGQNATVFIDKLGERLAFERTGIRIYEALLAKLDSTALVGDSSQAILNEFHHEELSHARIVRNALEQMGADSTVQTPCADIGGVEFMGIIQVLTDPRTNLFQCMHALLVVELTDNDGWQMLLQLARNMGQEGMVEHFQEALQQEQKHLSYVRNWLHQQIEQAAPSQHS